jgi:hypothetical protein
VRADAHSELSRGVAGFVAEMADAAQMQTSAQVGVTTSRPSTGAA